MRWRRPEVGDVRVKRRFLFFPKTALYPGGDFAETRWLQVGAWEEELIEGWPDADYWQTGCWVDDK